MTANVAGLANIDFGVSFIKNEPPATEHSKEHFLWAFRCHNGQCPHCGNKTHQRKSLLHVRRGFRPLTIDGYVDRGVCCHPLCKLSCFVSLLLCVGVC
jgi:hypothetical protein